MRVDRKDEHYIVNWHTGGFSLDPSRTYRIRVLIGGTETAYRDVKVVARAADAGGGSASQYLTVVAGRTVPIKFWIQKVRRLTVVLEDGVEGTPPALDTLYPYGASVPYRFSPARGYQNLQAVLNGDSTSAAGTLVMDRDHVLLVGADLGVTLPPGGEELLRSARAVMTSSNTVAAFQAHINTVARLYDELGWEAAAARMDSIYHLAYDIVEDSAALRRVDLALGNRVFGVQREGPAAAMSRAVLPGAASLAMAQDGARSKTVFFSVNGIFVGYGGAAKLAVETEKAVREEGLHDEVRFYYNSAFWTKQSFMLYVGQCFLDLAKKTDFWSIITWPFRLYNCIDRLRNYVQDSFDLMESFRQWSSLLGVMPYEAERDAVFLADTLRNRMVRERQNVVFMPHSQGNMMVQQALKLQSGPASPLCVGVVSLAAPLSGPWANLGPSQVTGVVVKGKRVGDVILSLQTNRFPTIETSRTRKADRKVESVDKWYYLGIVKLVVKAVWSVKLHFADDSYLGAAESRSAIQAGFRAQRDRLLARPACAGVAAVEVSPQATDIGVGETVQLSAVARDGMGNLLPAALVVWNSSNPSVAAVSGSGRVTGVSEGRVTITATSEGASGMATIAVHRPQVVFEDDFNAENGGRSVVNFTGFRRWNVTKGSVDLVGTYPFADFLPPENGVGVDLDGTTNAAGTLEWKESILLQPGEYVLSFQLAGCPRPSQPNTVVVRLGALYGEQFTLANYAPLTTYSRVITVTEPTDVKLVFEHLGGDNYGILLDNVKLIRR